jgi:dTDP-4-amino-4,6-dideoxygalactose transaminase
MDVPSANLSQQYETLKPQIDAAAGEVMRRCNYILGEDVGVFERAFATFVGSTHAVGVNSGTDAIHLGLRAADIGPGDEVITAANTFMATVEAIMMTGATPILADCDPDTLLIDPDAVAAAITPRTRAIVPVHLYGQPVDMDRLAPLVGKHSLVVVEDCAHAHGALLSGDRPCGTLGDAGAFSFYPSKNLGAFGDGGAVTTNNEVLAERIRRFGNLGSLADSEREVRGFNSRLDTMQAAILSVKLRSLAAWNEQRGRAAAMYRSILSDLDDVVLPVEAPWTQRHVWHIFAVRLPNHDRNRVLATLKERGIGAGAHYVTPVHLQISSEHMGLGPGSFPQAERACAEVLSLPIFPEITEPQIERVAQVLREVLASTA